METAFWVRIKILVYDKPFICSTARPEIQKWCYSLKFKMKRIAVICLNVKTCNQFLKDPSWRRELIKLKWKVERREYKQSWIVDTWGKICDENIFLMQNNSHFNSNCSLFTLVLLEVGSKPSTKPAYNCLWYCLALKIDVLNTANTSINLRCANLR